MADEKEIKGPESAGEEPEDSGPETPDNEAGGEDSGPDKGIGRILIGYRKWILLSLLALLLAMTGIGITFAPDLKGGKKEIASPPPPVEINEDNLSEEILSPFFVPPSDISSRGAIRVDLSVIWDRLSSIRFRKKETKIRNDLFRHITKAAEETEDLNSRVSSLEEEISGLLQESLGTGNVVIKIKEIKYL